MYRLHEISQVHFYKSVIQQANLPLFINPCFPDHFISKHFIYFLPPSSLQPSKMPSSTNPSFFLDQDSPHLPNLELAQFAAGCFWGVEQAFQHMQGVVKTEVGYTQGHLHEPTYPLVQKGDTGHAEAVRIHFDPDICKFEDLLQVFWSKHDPTSLNSQGKDVGTQYRSGIYYYNDAQAKTAKECLQIMERELNGKKIVTEILPAKTFYRAEEYHQQYLEKGSGPSCSDPMQCSLKQSEMKTCSNPLQCSGLKQQSSPKCSDPIRCFA